MRILGIDPGSHRTGWGVVEVVRTGLRGIAAGVIVVSDEESLPARLRRIYAELEILVREHAPNECAVEDVFYAKNAQAALKLGHARGVVLLAAASAELEVSAYPPAVVKRTVGGSGAADKSQVARMVGAILGWRELPSVDATDALAIAITHASARKSPMRATATRTSPRRRRAP